MWISVAECTLLSSALLVITTHAHLSFQIRYADSVSKVVRSRLLPCWGLPFLSLNLIKGAPSTVPIWTSSQEDSRSRRSFSARGQITFREGEFSHSKRMFHCFRFTTQCTMLLVFKVWDIAPMVTDFKTVVEDLPQEVPDVPWEVSVSLIPLQTSALVEVDPLSAWTANWVSATLIFVAILGSTDPQDHRY